MVRELHRVALCKAIMETLHWGCRIHFFAWGGGSLQPLPKWVSGLGVSEIVSCREVERACGFRFSTGSLFVRPSSGEERRQEIQNKQFENLNALELFCPKCGRSMPVRERLLLVLPEGDKYEYLCARCGTSVGDKIVKGEPKRIIIT